MLKLIIRYYKILWLKSTGTFEEQTKKHLKLSKTLDVVRRKANLSISCNFQSKKVSIYQKKSNSNSKNNPFVVKSLLQTNCKLFHKSTIRKKFNLKPEIEMKKFTPTNDATFFTDTAEMKRSCILKKNFIYVLTTFEHQIPEKYASRKS